MTPRRPYLLLPLLTALLLGLVGQGQVRRAAEPAPPPAVVTVSDRVLHPISPLLFGQFLEDTLAEEEGGVEAALLPGTRRLDPAVLALMKDLSPTLLRYPGGAKVTYSDWTNFIDNPPTDGWANPNFHARLGIDRFLSLCGELKAEPLLVVNFRKALLEEKPLHEAARRAAGLVAYCNAPLGAKLPPGMPDWPALRAKNGHPHPYGVKYFQIGNEMWIYNAGLRRQLGADYNAWHLQCLKAYIDAMRAVDPTIRLVTDAMSPEAVRLFRAHLGDRLDFIAMHQYRPWAIEAAQKTGRRVPGELLSAHEVWNAYVAIPQIDRTSGLSTIDLTEAREPCGYPVAVTEWNFNGWPCDTAGAFPLHSSWAKGLGAAGYLHAMLRANVALGTQSMMIGTTWGVTAIRVDPQHRQPPYVLPSGAVLAFYTRHHGTDLLDHSCESLPTYEQPYQMGLIRPESKVAALDTLVSADAKAYYVHLIHRAFDASLPVTVNLPKLPVAPEATLCTLSGHLHDQDGAREFVPLTRQTIQPITLRGRTANLLLPPRTVSALIIPRPAQTPATPLVQSPSPPATPPATPLATPPTRPTP